MAAFGQAPPTAAAAPVLLALSGAPEAPEPSQPAFPSITLQELLQKAKNDPPAVLVAHAELLRARAESSYAQGQWLPALSGQGTVGYSYDNRLVYPGIPRIDSESLDTRASLNFEWAALDSARGSRIDAAEASERARGFALASAQRKAVYFAAELVQAGTRSPVDAQRAKIEVLSAEYGLALRHTDALAAFAALASAIGLPPTALLRPASESAEFALTALNPAGVKQLAYDHRPEIRGAAATLSAAQHDRAAAIGERLPTVGASANGTVSYLDVRRGEGIGGHQYGGAAGVYLRWRGLDPAVWLKANVAAAAAEQADLERDAVVRAIGAEAVSAYYALERAKTEKRRAVAVLEAAAVAREAQNGRYVAGLSSLLELLDAEDLEQQARQRRIEAQRDEAIASALLLSVCGTLAQ
jgi:outer membrane protein TolC